MLTSIRGLLAATALAGAFAASVPAMAEETDPPKDLTISGNVALVTDYRFRGVSQSAGDPAIQGGLTVTHSSGLYASVWSSSVNFSNIGADLIYGNQELDLVAGWSGTIGSGVTADVGMTYYAYPGGHVGNAEFFEPYASLSATAGPAKFKLGVNYAWKQDALVGDDNLYLFSNVDVGVPNTPITLSGHLGYQDGPLAADFFVGPKMKTWDWSVGASVAVFGKGSLGVSYIGNGAKSVSGLTDDAVVGTLSFSF